MAKGIPSGYTRFLERLIADLPDLAKRQPDVASRLRNAELQKNDYMVVLSHLCMSSLRWAFRQNRLTKSVESKTFNVEFVPKRGLELSQATIQAAWREAGLQGEVGFDGPEVFFQLQWGYGNTTDNLVYDDHLSRSLREWAVDAMAVAIRLVEGLGTRVERTCESSATPGVVVPAISRRRLFLSNEEMLEDTIIENWAELDFGLDLEPVGRQIRCADIGIIDILARDRATGGFVVIELKRNQGDDEVFGQLARYMGWIAEHRDQPDGVPVLGIIIAAEITAKLRSAARTNANVRLLRYDLKIALSPVD